MRISDWSSDVCSSDLSQLLRLESDAHRVQVVTLHKSKGLEYPLVFMPFAAIGSPTRNPGHRAVVNGEGGRALHWKLLPSQSGWEAAKDAWCLAPRAEDARSEERRVGKKCVSTGSSRG